MSSQAKVATKAPVVTVVDPMKQPTPPAGTRRAENVSERAPWLEAARRQGGIGSC